MPRERAPPEVRPGRALREPASPRPIPAGVVRRALQAAARPCLPRARAPVGNTSVTMVDRRIGILFAAFIGLLGIAVLRAGYLGAVRAPSLRHAAASQQVTKVTLPAERGAITDRRGVELAITQGAADVAADPYLIKDAPTVARQLSPLLGKSEATLVAALSKPHTGFVYLAHLVPGDRVAQLAKLHIPGLTTIPQITRVYPRS